MFQVIVLFDYSSELFPSSSLSSAPNVYFEQECKKQSQTLLEQIVTGFFESHDVSFPSAPAVDKTIADQGWCLWLMSVISHA